MSVEAKKAEINQTGRAWVVATIAIIASILISANSNKLPATMSLVIPALGIDTGTAGNIMSLETATSGSCWHSWPPASS